MRAGGYAGLQLGVAELLFGRADGGCGRFDCGLLGPQLLLCLVICWSRGKAALQEFSLSVECGAGLRQEGLRGNESSFGGVKIGSLHLRIEPRQNLIRGDVVADLDEALLDLAADSKGYVAREPRLYRAR